MKARNSVFLVVAWFICSIFYDVNIFTYLVVHYESWSFWSNNFLMEFLILTLVTVPLFCSNGSAIIYGKPLNLLAITS